MDCSSREPPPKALIRSDIWFPDGNIVLIADCAAFKVHRGQLERHSDVFHDLFSIPQPPDESLVDGSPWVELYDRPSDLYHLLIALYDGLYFVNDVAVDFAVVSSVLRLSTKYFIEHLRKRCIARLARDWPTSLAEWDRREDDLTHTLGYYGPLKILPHPILIIQLALELNLDAFLPSAFYDLSRYSPSKVFAGTRGPPPIFSTEGDPRGQRVRLSDKYLCQTFVGRECAQMYIHTFLEVELRARHPSAYCLNAGRSNAVHCSESFYFIHLNTLRSVGGIAAGRDADPLYTLLQALQMLERTDFSDGVSECGLKLCPTCKADFTEVVKKARLGVWELIPEWFGLGRQISVEDID
ncbi:hypothetical protein K503DRAFT_771291 [Rhizopogon vinicolor AM-OR11-026]|uniref:BTB domain-containing protein n=1 Tax=Rhizopogon vinicolor AM-OR11-026 TaxID=1314800 RepID=A0A1B7MYE6_9AGAM|nr:hypothetical protein K503DRAFT_771291 [Rhizopogon vinicolor AM-OR11-026]